MLGSFLSARVNLLAKQCWALGMKPEVPQSGNMDKDAAGRSSICIRPVVHDLKDMKSRLTRHVNVSGAE